MTSTQRLTTSHQSLYDTDFVEWADRHAELLRQQRFSELDLKNLIEEVGDLGNRHRDALESQLTQLLMHLLKWQYQPEQRSGSWSGSIRESRKQLSRLLRKHPSLKNHLTDQLALCYEDAVEDAVDETGLVAETFPSKCQYTDEQILRKDFWPGES